MRIDTWPLLAAILDLKQRRNTLSLRARGHSRGTLPAVAVSAFVIPGGTGNRNLPHFSSAGSVFLSVVQAYEEVHINRYCMFSSMGAPTHQLTRKVWIWRAFIHHAEWAAAESSNSRGTALPRRILCCQESLGKQQQKALRRFFLIMSLSLSL